MAKKSVQASVNQYANRDEEIRKAKGNPNKNIHTKKANSNYGGYTAGQYMTDKLKDKVSKQERVVLPLWMRLGLLALLVVLIVLLVLRLTVYKDSLLLSYITTLILGATCVALFYIRRFRHQKKDGTGYKIISVALALFGCIYTVMGLGGLLTLWGVFG